MSTINDLFHAQLAQHITEKGERQRQWPDVCSQKCEHCKKRLVYYPAWFDAGTVLCKSCYEESP
ncbi:hypothetical protein IAD21_00931 [Abditibacteriota bacterium]|nr:hypothetical protein IAD21_00931 [Abditibacteriota bacterium]